MKVYGLHDGWSCFCAVDSQAEEHVFGARAFDVPDDVWAKYREAEDRFSDMLTKVQEYETR